MVLLHAIVAVIHAILRAAAEALIAGASLLILILVVVAILVGLIASLAGGLGLGGLRWIYRRRRPCEKPGDNEDPPPQT